MVGHDVDGPSQQSEEYQALLHDVAQIGQRLTPPQVATLCQNFAQDINSRRDQDRISNLDRLLVLLEKRNVLNWENVDVLNTIGRLINKEDQVNMHVQQYKRKFLESPTNEPQMPRPNVANREYALSNEVKLHLRSRVGRQWKTLARLLKVMTEADIEIIRDRYGARYDQCVSQVLDIFDEQMSRSRTRPMPRLMRALREMPRHDLIEGILNIDE